MLDFGIRNRVEDRGGDGLLFEPGQAVRERREVRQAGTAIRNLAGRAKEQARQYARELHRTQRQSTTKKPHELVGASDKLPEITDSLDYEAEPD